MPKPKPSAIIPSYEATIMVLLEYHRLRGTPRPFQRMIEELPPSDAQALIERLASKLGLEPT